MNELRDDLPTLPERMQRLPVSSKGYPVPYFVGYVDGEPDFRCVDPQKMKRCVRDHLCWLCGGRLGRHQTYTIGPMCIVNRVSSEPPSHYDCACFAAQACPFLTRPRAHRRDANMPENAKPPAGFSILRNPGAVALWTTLHPLKLLRAPNGFLFHVGEPERVEWFSEAHEASYAQVRDSFDSGVELLREVAAADGAEALAALDGAVRRAFAYLPFQPVA